MIEIKIDNNEVLVENQTYHSFNQKKALTALIADIIDKAKYSGESMILYECYYDVGAKKEMKRVVKQW